MPKEPIRTVGVLRTPEQRTKLLAAVPLFTDLPGPHLAALAAAGQPRRARKGQIVFAEGDPSDALLVVAQGRLKVYVTSLRGDELVLALAGAGDALGELGVLDGSPRSATVEALGDTELLRIDAATLHRMLRADPAAALPIIRSLCTLARRLTGTSAELAFLDVPRRLARLLLDLRTDDDAHPVVDTGLSQAGVAARIAASRQAVNEAMRGFERRGWILVHGQQVTLLQPAALEAYAGG